MAYTVLQSFVDFVERISLTGDHVDTVKTRAAAVVNILKDKFAIVETVPMGSVVNGTGLKGSADADLLVALNFTKHIKDQTPLQVIESLREGLKTYRTVLAKKNGLAVTLYFETWPNIDIVPAAQVAAGGAVTHYEIPDVRRGKWIPTNPKIHAVAMAGLKPRERELVRMIKEWNLAHSDLMQSFHIETLTLKIGDCGESPGWRVYCWFEGALKHIGAPLYHPYFSNGPVDDYLSYTDRSEIKTRLERARDQCRTAWYNGEAQGNDTRQAIDIYTNVFGKRFPAYG